MILTIFRKLFLSGKFSLSLLDGVSFGIGIGYGWVWVWVGLGYMDGWGFSFFLVPPSSS